MITFFKLHLAKRTLLLGALLAGLLLFYIFQINALTASVYSIGDQEKRLAQLQEQDSYRKTQQFPNFTRAHMEKLAQEMQLERVQNISYVKVLGSSVATTTNQE